MLPESRLHTFLDAGREFAVYFLEGQRLIHDLATLHRVQGAGFAYFRDALLSVQPMIAFLKAGEQLGFYIDSETPYFRLKIEAGHSGATRCALLPEDFAEFPEALHGIVRVQKLFPRNRPPYQSVIRVDGLPLRAIVNRVLRESYQTHSAVVVARNSDQSLLLHQLPPLPGSGEYDYSLDALRERRDALTGRLESIFDRALVEPAEIEAAFAELGFRRLVSRAVRFECSCSRERVLAGLASLRGRAESELFEPDEDSVEAVCEYCKTTYRVTRDDLAREVDARN